jgi:16S rRNA (guanine966-N2)-methyltransferase
MRIISGEFGGRILKTPNWDGTRPMTDKLRGALCDILAEEIPQARILDLFAGTGAVGIEALSRGAAQVDFVDISRKCFKLIKENLELVGAMDRAKIYCEDALNFLSNRAAVTDKSLYDLVFVTPPYADFDYGVLACLAPLVRAEGVVVAEKDRFVAKTTPAIPHFALYENKHYGDTDVLFFVKLA